MSWPEKKFFEKKDCPHRDTENKAIGWNEAHDRCTKAVREHDWPKVIKHKTSCADSGGYACTCGADQANAMRSAFLAKINELVGGL